MSFLDLSFFGGCASHDDHVNKKLIFHIPGRPERTGLSAVVSECCVTAESRRCVKNLHILPFQI